MDFIKSENEKIMPTEKPAPVKRKPRPEGMQDDSVSEITDLDKEEILAKYYGEVMSKVERRRRERAAARRRLWGEAAKLEQVEHLCRGPRAAA
jgi:hypothetical protein